MEPETWNQDVIFYCRFGWYTEPETWNQDVIFYFRFGWYMEPETWSQDVYVLGSFGTRNCRRAEGGEGGRK